MKTLEQFTREIAEIMKRPIADDGPDSFLERWDEELAAEPSQLHSRTIGIRMFFAVQKDERPRPRNLSPSEEGNRDAARLISGIVYNPTPIATVSRS